MPHPFDDLPPTPASHFTLYFYAAVLRLLEHLAALLGPDAAFEQFPFLAGYHQELARRGPPEIASGAGSDWWRERMAEWEAAAREHLPLRALREAGGLNHAALTLLLGVGLGEEDARFGMLFEVLHGTPGQRRPTVGLLSDWRHDTRDMGEARTILARLRDLGLIQVSNADAPRAEWALQPQPLLWDCIRGASPPALAPWLAYHPQSELAACDELIVPEPTRRALETIPALLAGGQADALIVRGPRQNGRRTLLGAVARTLGRGMLSVSSLTSPTDDRWRLVGPLATALGAMPVIVCDVAPGETAELPVLACYAGPLGITLGRQGGIAGPAVGRGLTLTLDQPGPQLRREHWLRGLGGQLAPEQEAITGTFRMTGGNIRRAAQLAQSFAALGGRAEVTLADVRQAARSLNRQALDTLATYVPAEGSWSQLATCRETIDELHSLERRCRHRERLVDALGAASGVQLNAGVRTLFSGPSGTGKTLAARLLAATLGLDLYRVDLAAVVNKYIGETEKNLERVFARAEELDVILLLDEGDALLTRRTGVNNANDRYANLETNYLLQRLESFDGILIVTTNAAQRIDDAFQRRIDVIVEFRAPESEERWVIWQMHLPPQHAVPYELLEEVAYACALSGGQIRNAAIYAALQALDNGGVVTGPYLEAAVQREYRKIGAVCPLR